LKVEKGSISYLVGLEHAGRGECRELFYSRQAGKGKGGKEVAKRVRSG